MERAARFNGIAALAGVAALIVGCSGTVASAADISRPAPGPAAPSTLTGDWGGIRSALKDRGLDLTVNYIGEVLGDSGGGLRQGGLYEDRFEFSADADLARIFGWAGATAHVTVFQIDDIGGRIGPDFVGSISDPSNIDALPTTRLFTAWFQQSFFNDRASLRAGQLAADDEFFTSPTAGGLINGTFGWDNLFAANLPAGGPAYPLATPGIRLMVRPTDNLTVLAAAFSGNPAGANCTRAPQICNRYGTTFSFSGGTFSMLELQYAVNPQKDAAGLPGVYKLGGWYHSGRFADQHFGLDAAGFPVSLASAAAVGPLEHRGNWGLYGIADQTVWRAAHGPQAVRLFARGGGTEEDRNVLSFYVDGGIGVTAPLPGRDDDVFTLGISYSKVSNAASALDIDIRNGLKPLYPIRDDELVIEASYQIQMAPYWIVQPDIQYIMHPGGNVPNPDGTSLALKDDFVFGARTTVKF